MEDQCQFVYQTIPLYLKLVAISLMKSLTGMMLINQLHYSRCDDEGKRPKPTIFKIYLFVFSAERTLPCPDCCSNARSSVQNLHRKPFVQPFGIF